MTEKSMIRELAAQVPNRRSFMKKVGIASAAVGAAGVSGAMAQSGGPGDANILNFALNLEFLEAEFYTYATTGQGITQAGIVIAGTGTAGATTGGASVTFTDAAVQAIVLELASDERTHVTLLQGAIASLGASPVAKPAINLNALGFGFNNMTGFLTLARIFEDIGVTAYGGAAPLIQSSAILGYAARILATEALHSGNIRAQISRLGISTLPPLDGADHLPPPSGTEFFPTDTSAITETRTPGQVLYLAYGAPNATSGGFFPNGMNGTLNTSAAAAATTDGAMITLTPNPIHVVAGAAGTTTVSWNAPTAQIIQVRIGNPAGALFTDYFNSGSMQTAAWVTNGMTFYLQDVSNNKPLTAANTLATVVATLVTP